jgi:hypothetical protein
MKALITALLATVLLGGCAVPMKMVPTGGSRADGTVKLSYDYGAFQVPKLDPAQGVQDATGRCKAWGYTGAEAFGGSTTTCINSSMGGCNMYRATVEFQCTGNPPPRS